MTTPTKISNAVTTLEKLKPDQLSKISESKLIDLIQFAAQMGRSHYKASVAYAIVQGIMLSQAKATVVHSNFKLWIKENLPGISYITANRYRKLAEALRDQKYHSDTFEIEEIINLPSLSEDRLGEILAQVEKLTDGQSLTELYFDFDIVRKPDPRGGKRLGKPGKLTAEEIATAHQENWAQKRAEFLLESEEKTWTHLDRDEREETVGILESLVKEMKASL